METIGGLISVVDKKVPVTWILLVLFVFMLLNQNAMSKDISQINHKLGNHITDTNKKIDNLSDRIDDLSGRFDRLYEILIKDKIK